MRIDDESREVEVAAVIFGFTFGQRDAQRPHRVVGACTAIVERRAEHLELFAQGSDADTEDHPSVGHLVEGAVST